MSLVLLPGDVAGVGGEHVVLVEPGAVPAGVVDPAPLGELVRGEAGVEVVLPARDRGRTRAVEGLVALEIERAEVAVRRPARVEGAHDIRRDVAAVEETTHTGRHGRRATGARPGVGDERADVRNPDAVRAVALPPDLDLAEDGVLRPRVAGEAAVGVVQQRVTHVDHLLGVRVLGLALAAADVLPVQLDRRCRRDHRCEHEARDECREERGGKNRDPSQGGSPFRVVEGPSDTRALPPEVHRGYYNIKINIYQYITGEKESIFV